MINNNNLKKYNIVLLLYINIVAIIYIVYIYTYDKIVKLIKTKYNNI